MHAESKSVRAGVGGSARGSQCLRAQSEWFSPGLKLTLPESCARRFLGRYEVQLVCLNLSGGVYGIKVCMQYSEGEGVCVRVGCEFWDALRVRKCTRWNKNEGLLRVGAPKCVASEFSPCWYVN